MLAMCWRDGPTIVTPLLTSWHELQVALPWNRAFPWAGSPAFAAACAGASGAAGPVAIAGVPQALKAHADILKPIIIKRFGECGITVFIILVSCAFAVRTGLILAPGFALTS